MGCALVGMLLVVPGRAEADRRVGVVDLEAPAALEVDAAAISLMLRSLLDTSFRPGVSAADLADALTSSGTGAVDDTRAAAVLSSLGADRLVAGHVSETGTQVEVILRVYGEGGELLGNVTARAPRGDVEKITKTLIEHASNLLDNDEFKKPRGSIGQLRPYIAAASAMRSGDVEAAGAALAAARPFTAHRVSAVKEIAASVAAVDELPLDQRVIAALAGNDISGAMRMAEAALEQDPKNAVAVAALARVHLARFDSKAAAAELKRAKRSKHPFVVLTRAALAIDDKSARKRNAALGKLLAGDAYVPALVLIADLAPGALGKKLERTVVKAAATIDHPGLASLLGLRAARAGIDLQRALELIAVVDLDNSEVKWLAEAVEKAVEKTWPVGFRLRAELMMRAGNARKALEDILAALDGRPADAELLALKVLLEAELAASGRGGEGVELADPKAGKTRLDDGASSEPTKRAASVADLAAELPQLLEAFDALTDGRVKSLVVAPLSGSAEAFYWPYRVHPDQLRDGLVDALKSRPYGIKIAEVEETQFDEPISKSRVHQLAEEHRASGVILYGVRAKGSKARVRVVLYLAAEEQAVGYSEVLPGKRLGLVSWNPVFLGILAAMFVAIVLFVVLRIVRRKGSVDVRLDLDTHAEDEAFGLTLSRNSKPPSIGDPTAHATKLRKEGYKHSRYQANMVTKKTLFEGIPVGAWWVHVVGSYVKGGVRRAQTGVLSKEIKVASNVVSLVKFDLVPKTTEYKINVFDGTSPVVGIEVWFDDRRQEKVLTNSEGRAVLHMPRGDREVRLNVKNMRIAKPVRVSDTKIHTLSINLERERRMAEAVDGIELDTSGDAARTPVPPHDPSQMHSPNMFDSNMGRDDITPTPPPEMRAATPVVVPAPASAATQALSSEAASAFATTPVVSSSESGSLSGLSRYKPEDELGRGAMGVVYRATDRVLERPVALKVMSPEVRKFPVALKMFLQEAKALAALNHPNIVTVFDQGEDNGETFMVMEFVEGTTLEARLERETRMGFRDAIGIAEQVCNGLAYAHKRRVIHRDIKPANIFIAEDGTVKLGDFGLARVLNELKIRKTEIRGTPLYMAPEQIRGTDIDFRVDLYAVGCTLFELLTGRPPFIEGEILYHHLHTEPPKPSELVSGIPAKLEMIVMACIAKNKEERFRSAGAVRDALRSVR
jgi:predicted Ser/Thr protein kinase